jgi:hypothetical protein
MAVRRTGAISSFAKIPAIRGRKPRFRGLNVRKPRLRPLMRAGRSWWKIENETFNTLKNLGYHFEHNYGHGKDNLSTLFAYLMLMAFLIDQIVQYKCHIFKALDKGIYAKIRIRERMRAVFQIIESESMEFIYRKIAHFYQIQLE